jgi:hypothetical protein
LCLSNNLKGGKLTPNCHRLPDKDDSDPELESHLLSALLACLGDFASHAPAGQHDAVSSVVRMFERTERVLTHTGYIDEQQLIEEIGEICCGSGTSPRLLSHSILSSYLQTNNLRRKQNKKKMP